MKSDRGGASRRFCLRGAEPRRPGSTPNLEGLPIAFATSERACRSSGQTLKLLCKPTSNGWSGDRQGGKAALWALRRRFCF